ncbi:MAG: universal stress protein [Anaerovoracaceae bacterium]|jgi:nucleotide-binding universal stress UspA family protein
MKKILVPIDGSEYSDRAILKAKEIAKAFDSKVILLNIMSVVSAINYYPNMRYAHIDDWLKLVTKAKEHSKELLETSKKAFGDIADQVEAVIIDEPGGNVARVISDYANENNIDLIVMGSNGMGSLSQRMYLGSVTTKVLHIVTKPVLVVQ